MGSITKVPQCVYCGQVFETWTGNQCQCDRAKESRAAQQAAEDTIRAIKPTKPVVTVVDDSFERLRREFVKDQAKAAKQAARDVGWDDVQDRKLALAQQGVAERERLASTSDDSGPTSATLDQLTHTFADAIDLTPTPAILDRRHGDGGMVLPAQKLNWIYGLPGSGKSFLGEIGVQEAVLRGGRSLYLDYEDTARTFHERAAILGFDPKAHSDSFRYIHGGLADAPLATAEALEWLAGASDPTMNLVVVDAAESSGCPSDGSDVNPWLARMVRPWRDHDHGVSILDHIPKRSEDRPDGPIGSQRKLAAPDGISLLVSGYCWTKSKSGRLSLLNHKDRTGNYAKNQIVAVVIGEWEGEGETRSFAYRIVEGT